MPELRECYAHYLLAKKFLDDYGDTTDLTILAIWADRTRAENAACEPPIKDEDVTVTSLDSTSVYTRGNTYNQSPIYPDQLKSLDDGSTVLQLSMLKLQGVYHTHRSLILDFGPLWFQVSFLTHSSVQIYSKAMWNSSILLTPKKERKFKVGICFEFREYCMVIPSLDLVIQPKWTTTPPKRCGIEIPYVWDDFPCFLKSVADWAESILTKRTPTCASAIQEISNDEVVWAGVGVYTSSELFFDAGISPFISLYELVSVSSRLARLACSYLSFAIKTRDDLWSLLSPCMVDGVLAPSTTQRLKYKDWLHVWAKRSVRVSERMSDLISAYNRAIDWANVELDAGNSDLCRLGLRDLYDPFEPVFVRTGLDAYPLLGSTIFGELNWVTMKGTPSIENKGDSDNEFQSIQLMRTNRTNPLEAMYTRLQKNRNCHVISDTFLRLDPYDQLYTEISKRKGKYVKPYSFKFGNQVWSVVLPFASGMRITEDKNIGGKVVKIKTPSMALTQHPDDETRLKYFDYVVQHTDSVAIGPLEYCGNGKVLTDTHKRPKLYLTPLDPQLRESEIIRMAKANHRKEAEKKEKKAAAKAKPATRTGMSNDLKSGMTSAQVTSRDRKIQKDINVYRASRSRSVSSSSSYLPEDNYHPSDNDISNDEDPRPPSSSGGSVINADESEEAEEYIETRPLKRRRMSEDQRLIMFQQQNRGAGSGSGSGM